MKQFGPALLLSALLGTVVNPLSTNVGAPRRSTTNFIALDGFGATIPGAERALFRDLTFEFSPSKKYALVGPNGCGKSTLVKQIVQKYNEVSSLPCPPLPPLVTDGEITVPHSTKHQLGYVSQSSVSLSDKSLLEECISAVRDYDKIKLELEAVQQRVADGDFDDETLNELNRLETQFDQIGGYNLEKNIMTVLKGLSFKDEDAHKPCTSFSGGWQMRISLCKLLISRPSFMILDEPSNHLDSAARSWLQNRLSEYEGCILLISHDVNLVNKVTDNIIEFNPVTVGGLAVYKNVKSYEAYLEEKERRYLAKLAEWERNKAEADRLQAFVDKFGASATKAKAAQSKLKAIERMRKDGMLDHPGELSLVGVTEGAQLEEKRKVVRTKVKFPTPPPAGEVLMELNNAGVAYKDEPVLLDGVNLSIEAGMRIIIRGANGAGKSTLLQALTDTEDGANVVKGERWLSPGAKLNVFQQDLAQNLDPSLTPVESVAEIVREYDIGISDTTIRSVLGQLSLSSTAQQQKIGLLSGGEKARVALASFILKPANILVLDEPSNHVDVGTIQALASGLADFESDVKNKAAAVIVVSHDRDFVERLHCTHVLMVEDGKVRLEERLLKDSDWEVEADGRVAAAVGVKEEVGVGKEDGGKQVELSPEDRKRKFNAPKRIKKIEAMVEKKEGRIQELEAEMIEVGSDVGKVTELSKESEKLGKEVEELMEEWAELEELLA